MNTLCGYRALDKEVTLGFLGICFSFFPKSQKSNVPCRNSRSQAMLGCSCSKLSFGAFPWNFGALLVPSSQEEGLSPGNSQQEKGGAQGWRDQPRIHSRIPQVQKCGNSLQKCGNFWQNSLQNSPQKCGNSQLREAPAEGI